jgi:hypothetical protein
MGGQAPGALGRTSLGFAVIGDRGAAASTAGRSTARTDVDLDAINHGLSSLEPIGAYNERLPELADVMEAALDRCLGAR